MNILSKTLSNDKVEQRRHRQGQDWFYEGQKKIPIHGFYKPS